MRKDAKGVTIAGEEVKLSLEDDCIGTKSYDVCKEVTRTDNCV